MFEMDESEELGSIEEIEERTTASAAEQSDPLLRFGCLQEETITKIERSTNILESIQDNTDRTTKLLEELNDGLNLTVGFQAALGLGLAVLTFILLTKK